MNERQHNEKTTTQKEQDNISEILINKGMRSKESISNDKINIGLNKQEIISQVKQISNKLIQDSNYHTNLIRLGHKQTEKSEPIKIPETCTKSKNKEVKNQTKKLERGEGGYQIHHRKDKK